MRRFIAALVVLAVWRGAATAHEYAIYPVNVNLKIEPDRIVVHFDSQAGYWYAEILGVPFQTQSLRLWH